MLFDITSHLPGFHWSKHDQERAIFNPENILQEMDELTELDTGCPDGSTFSASWIRTRLFLLERYVGSHNLLILDAAQTLFT